MSEIKEHEWTFNCKNHKGICFGRFDNLYYLAYKEFPSLDNGITDVIFLRDGMWESAGWSSFPDAESQLLYLAVSNAINNTENICAVTSRKLLSDYKEILNNEFSLKAFDDYNDKDTSLMYSESDHVLVRYNDYENNRLLIASNDIERLENIIKKYKVKWLKKNNVKSGSGKNIATDKQLTSFEERISVINDICFSGKVDKSTAKLIEKQEKMLNANLPEGIRIFYKYFNGKVQMFESCCQVNKISDLSVSDNGEIKIASNFEGEGQCFYSCKEKKIKVYFENDDDLIFDTEDFILMLSLYQSAFVLTNNCLIDKEKIPEQIYHFKIDNRKWIISEGNHILGFPYNNDECMLISKRKCYLTYIEKRFDIKLKWI